jgi:hypothetical protein
VVCAELHQVGLDPDKVIDIQIVWAAPSVSSAAAIVGHLLLVLRQSREGEVVETAYSMAANYGANPPVGIPFVRAGLTGGFPSRIEVGPLVLTANRYAEYEQRDLRRYRWILDGAQKERLVERLNDLIFNWKRPYYFFHQNCVSLIVELANAADQTLHNIPIIAPPDLVLAYLARRGAIEALDPKDIGEISPMTQGLVSRRQRIAAIRSTGLSSKGAQSRRKTSRDSFYKRLLKSADALTPESVAWNLAVAGPVERALISQPDWASRRLYSKNEGREDLPPSYIDLIAWARANVPPEIRFQQKNKFDDFVLASVRESRKTGRLQEFTAYAPFTLGAGLASDESSPLLALERAVVQTEYGEARQFAPTIGVTGAILKVRLMGRFWDNHRLLTHTTLLDAHYLPDPILRNLPVGIHLKIGDVYTDSHHQITNARWIQFGPIVSLLHSEDWSTQLNFFMGAAFDSRFHANEIVRNSLSAPIGLRLFSDWAPVMPVQQSWRLTRTHQWPLQAEYTHRWNIEGDFRVGMGVIADTKVLLSIQGSAEIQKEQITEQDPMPDTWLMGLRFERL